MKISRTSISDVRLIPRHLRITVDEWINYANGSMFLVARSIRYGDEIFKPNYFLRLSEKMKGVEFIWRAGNIYISYDKISSELIVYANKIADDLNAVFYVNDSTIFPRYKIQAAKKQLAKKSNEPLIEYQKESFGGNNMWLAIRSNATTVKNFFNLDGEQKSWQEGLRSMHACTHMFLFEFRGWVFLAGQLVDSLFAEDGVKGEKAIEKRHVDKLLEWGKTFTDVQLFMHYDRSEYFNAFYRVLNGKLEYGEYETESYQKKYGKMPKNIKELPDNNANTVAIEWSYEPDYLRYQIELKNAKAWILNVK